MRLSNRDRFIFRVAAGYAVTASAWFILSESIEALFSLPDAIIAIDAVMDSGFVIVTTILLVNTIRRVPVAAPFLAPPPRNRLRLLWYPFAIASTLAVLWLRQSLDAAVGTQPGLILFTIPIVLSAYLGGLGPGLTATILTGVVSDYFLLSPPYSIKISSPLAFAQLIALVVVGAILSAVFEALRHSRSRAQTIGALQTAIVESSQEAIYSVSPSGIVMSWNRAAEHLFGYAAVEIIGQPIETLVMPGREREMLALNESIMRGEATTQSRTQRSHKNGSIVDISVSASPVYNAEGQIAGSSRIARDIGDLARTERTQQSLLATMSAVIEQAPVMIAMLDRDLNYLATSQLWAAHYGGGDLTGRNHYDVLGTFPDAWREVNRRALAGETIRNDEDRVVRPDGSVRWLRWVVQPWTDANGQIGGLIVVDEDYTDRKNAEEALRESEQRFATVFRHSAVGIAITDTLDGGRFIEANDAWAKIVGYTRDDLIGRTSVDLNLWPDLALRRAMYDVISVPSATWRAESKFRHKNGTLVDVAITVSQIEIGGRPHGIAIAYDYSERKRLETDLRHTTDQLAAFIDASPVGIIGVDTEDRILTWNRAASEIFGFTADEAAGQRLFELAPTPTEDKPLLDERARRREQGEVTRSLPSRRQRKDGSWAKLAVSAGNLQDASGEPTGTILVMEDVTEREKLHEQLAQAQKMEAIGQLTGGVAHDFNNLLTVVLGNLELIQDRLENEPQIRRWAEAATDAGRNGADLVHRLLAFSRRQPLEPTRTDLNQRIAKFVPLLKRTLGEAIQVRQKLNDQAWFAMIDPAQFDSALLNLAVNARDAMPNGGWIEITTDNVVVDKAYASQNVDLEHGDFVRVSVSDSGHGMTPEILAHVFEPFFTTKETGKGTGLGMSMVYGFIKQSGGNISIYSESGKGTVVNLLLPRATPSAPAIAAIGTTADPVRGGETILVVEDDDDVRTVTVLFLKKLGYTVLDSANGDDALALLAEHTEIDLLFSDVILAGGETGVDIAARAQAMRPGLKVLFASGYTEEALTHNRQFTSKSLLLRKPFTRTDLSLKVREVLGQIETIQK